MALLAEYSIFLIYYVAWIVALLGFGSAFLSLARRLIPFDFPEAGGHLTFLVTGVAGMILATTLATLANFILPVGIEVSALIAGAGVVLFIIKGKAIIVGLSRAEITLLATLAALLFVTIPFTWLCWYDTGVYHVQAIKWIIESQVPLGLANLHGRFGFNCSWFMLSALVDQWVIYLNKPYFIVNAILTFFYASAVLLVVKRKFLFKKYEVSDTGIAVTDGDKRYPVRLSDLFLFFSSIALVYPGLMFLTSPSPDMPIMLLTLLVIDLVILDLESPRGPRAYLLTAVVLSAYAMTVKLSALPLMATALLLAYRLFAQKVNNSTPDRTGRGAFYFLTASVASILLPWVGRGLLLSGSLLFPFSVGYFSSLPWAAPARLAENEVTMTAVCGRSVGSPSAASGLGWILPWAKAHILGFWLDEPLFCGGNLLNWLTFNLYFIFIDPSTASLYPPAALLFAAIVLYLYSVRHGGAKSERLGGGTGLAWKIPTALAAVGLAFWFYSAPDVRFGIGWLYSLSLIALGSAVLRYIRKKTRDEAVKKDVAAGKKIGWIMAIFLALILVYGYIIVDNYANKVTLGSNGFNFPIVETKASKTLDGAVIYTMADVDRLWNAPLPSSPYFNETLKVRYSNSTGLPDMFWYEDKNSLPIPL